MLVPVDFSDRSLSILVYVRKFARKYNFEVIPHHALNPVYAIPEAGVSEPTMLPVPEWVFTNAAEKLDQFAASELAGLPVRRLVCEGDAAEQSVTAAQTEAAQLIVMPTHDYGIFRRLLIGSTTAKVLHDMECPVLTAAQMPASNRSGATEDLKCGLCNRPRQSQR